MRFLSHSAVQACLWWLIWLAIFLPAIHVAERLARPIGIDDRETIAYRLLDGEGNLLPGGPFLARSIGLEGYVVNSPDNAERIVFLIDFDLEKNASPPQALYFSLREQIVDIRVNGTVIRANVSIPKLEGLLSSEPALYLLPNEALLDGRNLIEVQLASFGIDTALSPFVVGPADYLTETYRWRNFFVTDLGLISIGVQLFVLLLMALINWPAEERARIRALMLIIACNAAGSYWLSFSPPFDLSLLQFVIAWGGLNLALGVAVLAFALRDAAILAPLLRRMRWVWLAVFTAYAVAYALLPVDADWALTGLLNATYAVCTMATVVASAALAYAVVYTTPARRFERSVLALSFGAMALDRIGTLVDLHSPFDAALPLTLTWAPILGTFLGLSMVLALAREAARARRVVAEANVRLAQALAAREAELDESYRQQRHMLRQAAVHEERQRLVRDMHDGIGGELMSLKLKAESGVLDHETMRAGITTSLNDLRLIVDSLDCADDGVSLTLIAFERRLRQQLSGTGCSIEVVDDIGAVETELTPKQTLNVLRVLQEAVTNAIWHGKATHLRLCARYLSDERAFEFQVLDNGCGFDAAHRPGHGLRNMQQRAAASGGQCQVSSDARGTQVTLLVPAAGPE